MVLEGRIHAMSEYIYGIKAWDKYPGVTVGLEVITPETAIAMLETNENNRAMKREPLERAIENGEWALTNDMIVFSDEGKLLNGQNRLAACAKTGKPIVAFVARGFKREWQLAMDGGVKRQVADFLKMRGYKNSIVVGSIGTTLCRISKVGFETAFVKKNSSMVTTNEVIVFIEDCYDSRIKPILHDCMAMKSRYKGVSTGTWGALLDAFKKIDAESYAEFVGMLRGDYAADWNVGLLKDKLKANSENKNGRYPQKIVAALVIKTWNAFISGERIEKLRFRAGGAHPEAFPEVFEGWE